MYLQVHQAQEVTIFPGHSKAGVLVIIFFRSPSLEGDHRLGENQPALGSLWLNWG